MTNQEFLAEFQKHLDVAQPKRAEILIETQSHLAEGKNLGQPKIMAEKMNQVYFGRFGTFRWLLIRVIFLGLVDWFLSEAIQPIQQQFGRSALTYTVLTVSLLIHIGAVTNVIVSAHAISHMFKRWTKAGWWTLAVIFSTLVILAYVQLRYPAQAAPLGQSIINFSWNVFYLSLNSFIFIPVFFTVWPQAGASWLKKLGTLIITILVAFGLLIAIDDLFRNFFTWLYTYPLVLKALPNGIPAWPFIYGGIIVLFLLHEFRFSFRRLRKMVV